MSSPDDPKDESDSFHAPRNGETRFNKTMSLKRYFCQLAVATSLSTPLLAWADPSVKIEERMESPYRFERFDAPQKERISKLVTGAISWAKKSFNTDLDETDASIAKVEAILSVLHDSYAKTNPKPSDDVVQNYCFAFGSYVGHVFQKNHGGEWGKAIGKTPADVEVAVQGTGTMQITLLPWRRVCSRITQGPSMNVYEYYKVAVSATKAR